MFWSVDIFMLTDSSHWYSASTWFYKVYTIWIKHNLANTKYS